MLSDDALERIGTRKGRGRKKKEKKLEDRKSASGFEDAEEARGERKVAMWEVCGGDDEWIFRSETPPRSRGPEKHPLSFETRFESKPGSPFDLLPRSHALRSKSNATSFFPNGWTRRA